MDIVQFAIMMAATLVYAVIVVREAGGLGLMTERLRGVFDSGASPMSASQLLAFTPSAAYNAGALLLAVVPLWMRLGLKPSPGATQ